MHTLLLNRLSKLESEGAHDQAVQLFEKESMPRPRASDELATHVSILRIVGRCYEAQSNWANAKDCYEKAISYSHKIGYHTHDLEASIHLCNQQPDGKAAQTTHYESAAGRQTAPEWQPFRASL
jgi:tetratricopeptide (TPR) repeat protein